MPPKKIPEIIPGYIGNKVKELPLITEVYQPFSDKITTFIDVFGGGGCVSLNIPKGKEVFINDINKTNIEKYFIFKNKNKELLKNFKTFEIISFDYKELLEIVKNEQNVMCYLDPPYLSEKNDDNYYGTDFNLNDYFFLSEFIKVCKCKMIINIPSTPWVDDHFNQFIKSKYSLNRSGKSSRSKKQDFNANYCCFICNF